MKVKLLSRNPDEYMRETKNDIHIEPRNYDPALHPMESGREYQRALNAAKLQKVFAKPFLTSLDGHRDVVSCMCKHPKQLSTVVSGAGDGEIRMWNLTTRRCLKSFTAHEGNVRGICFNRHGRYYFSCGDDNNIKQWKFDSEDPDQSDEPMNTILGKAPFYGVDHHWEQNVFATCGSVVEIWNEDRAEPMRTFQWGVDSVTSIKFNPVETNLVGATGSDRSVLLYDIRGSAALRKVVLKMRSNALVWNPMEAYHFTLANEDYNLYTFDLRKLSAPLNVHMDHVLAVLDVDYSPTGKYFVSGSYDKTVRIFDVNKGRSREVYHTKRMQRVTGVLWSLDNNFIMSASDEMNLRLWKADASKKLGLLQPREKVAFNYSAKLKEKYNHHPEVRRILHHRHLPKSVYAATKVLRISRAASNRKEANRRAHSKPGAVPHVPEKQKHVEGEME